MYKLIQWYLQNAYVGTQFYITYSCIVCISIEDNILTTPFPPTVLPLHLPPPCQRPKSDSQCGDIKQILSGKPQCLVIHIPSCHATFELIESLNLLVWSNLQNCKFLETWIKKLCSIYHKSLVIDKWHAYETCGKKCVKKGVEMNE